MASAGEIVRGGITRFLPGAVAGQAMMIALLLIGEPGLEAQDLPMLAAFAGLLTAGFVGSLVALRARLREDAEVTGRRALISGMAAGAFQFGVAAALNTLTVNDGYILAPVAGAAAALAVFFPWLRTRREPAAEPQISPEILSELALPEARDIDWPTAQREAERVRRER